MDNEQKNKIRDLLDVIVSSHNENYPSDGERIVLIDTVSNEFNISIDLAEFKVIEYFSKIKKRGRNENNNRDGNVRKSM